MSIRYVDPPWRLCPLNAPYGIPLLSVDLRSRTREIHVTSWLTENPQAHPLYHTAQSEGECLVDLSVLDKGQRDFHDWLSPGMEARLLHAGETITWHLPVLLEMCQPMVPLSSVPNRQCVRWHFQAMGFGAQPPGE